MEDPSVSRYRFYNDVLYRVLHRCTTWCGGLVTPFIHGEEASWNALVALVSGRIAWHMTTTRGFPVTQEAPRIISGAFAQRVRAISAISARNG